MMIDNSTHLLAFFFFFFSTLQTFTVTWGDRFRPLPPPCQWSLRHWTTCPSFEAKFQTQTWLNWKACSSLHHNTLPFKYGSYTEVKLCQKDVPTTYNTGNCIMTRSLSEPLTARTIPVFPGGRGQLLPSIRGVAVSYWYRRGHWNHRHIHSEENEWIFFFFLRKLFTIIHLIPWLICHWNLRHNVLYQEFPNFEKI